jgi:hypothetical protein
MKPVREQLMDLIRANGGNIKENDHRIPALLKQLKEILEDDSGPSDDSHIV